MDISAELEMLGERIYALFACLRSHKQNKRELHNICARVYVPSPY
jgi:hypothetical protein